jgi:hypothetical protein
MVRGGLASLIYRSAMATKTGDDELAAVTLMSEDIDNIIGYLEPIFDIPASIVGASIGLWLLWRQLGPVSLVPIFMLVGCSYLQKLVGSAMSERRAIWTKAIQKRVALTTNLLRSMKSVKMTGLVGASARLVQAERVHELKLGKGYRWFVVWMNAFGETSVVLCPTSVADCLELAYQMTFRSLPFLPYTRSRQNYRADRCCQHHRHSHH